MRLGLLTSDLPGAGGVLRRAPEDFQVEEIPLYAPCGEGEHLYFEVWKRGISTFEAVRRIAKGLGVPEATVAYAGLKDARAVTTQWMSVEARHEAALRSLAFRDMRLSGFRRHGNRLRVGHLLGNRFRIVVRDAAPDGFERARAVLDVLVRRGCPNYFMEQRFGARLNSHLCGEAIVRRDHAGFLRHLLGGPSELEGDPRLREARRLFDEGRLREAFAAMPIRCRTEKKALHALLRFGDPERAYFAVPKRMRQMFASSFQSRLFNAILERRVAEVDRLAEGDLAYLHRNGAVFLVTDPAAEQPRCDAFEVSPSGPIWGTLTPIAQGRPGEVEREILGATGLSPESFEVGGGLRLKGRRRPLRVPLEEVSLEPLSDRAFAVGFTLPPGSFATAVMAEITKNGAPQAVD